MSDKIKIILLALVLSIVIWVVIGWVLNYIGWNGYGFIRALLTAVVWYFAIEIFKIIKNNEE